jgi:hypothetical protein
VGMEEGKGRGCTRRVGWGRGRFLLFLPWGIVELDRVSNSLTKKGVGEFTEFSRPNSSASANI